MRGNPNASLDPKAGSSLNISTWMTLKRLLVFAWPYRRLFLMSALLIPLAAGFQLTQPYMIKIAIDRYIANAQVFGIVVCAIIYLSALVCEGLTNYAQSYIMTRASQHSLFAIRNHLTEHMLHMPTSFYDRHSVGGLVSRVTSDVESINELFVSGVISLIKDLVILIAIVIVLLNLNLKLALVSFTLIPLLSVVVYKLQQAMRRAYAETRQAVGKLNAYLSENVAGIEVVKLFQRERKNLQEFKKLSREHMTVSFRSIKADALLYALVEAFASITIAGVIWYGGKTILAQFNVAAPAVGTDMLTLGTLVAFIEYLTRFFTPLRDLSGKFSIIQMAAAAGERVIDILDRPRETDVDQTKTDTPLITHSNEPFGISVENISLTYQTGDRVLKDISLDIRPGERLAIVGATGSGKTSLARLLLRLYDFQEGHIYLKQGSQKDASRVEIRDIPLAVLRNTVGMVPQDVVIFSGSALENVTLEANEISDVEKDRLQEAFERSQLNKHIQPETILGERGYNLSAGQKQLLAFARILYFDPGVVIFDEATSNIDAETEREVQAAMQEVLKQRTSLIIAHRLSTVRGADRIVVMHKGEIVSLGTHQELLNSSPIYATLVKEYYGKTTGRTAN